MKLKTETDLTEQVARAIWESKKEPGLPLWSKLNHKIDRKLMNEIRAMADAAISAVGSGLL